MNEIVRCVLEQYNKLPSNAKPKLEHEFTIIAGFVAEVVSEDLTSTYQLISLATGTKCVGYDLIDEQGRNIVDSHAEILARRCLVRYLMREVINSLQNVDQLPSSTSCLTKSNDSKKQPYRIKDNWKFHLYISDSPCGDASIYLRKDGKASFTGAKIMESKMDATANKPIENANQSSNQNESIDIPDVHCSHCIVREATDQIVGVVRTKAGRSDNRYKSYSMSCSDKVCKWIALGLQGELLRPILGKVSLSSVVVGHDPSTTASEQLTALQRALVDRFVSSEDRTYNPSITVQIVEAQLQFQHSKGRITALVEKMQKEAEDNLIEHSDSIPLTKKRKREKLTISAIPCVTSILWQCANSTNVLKGTSNSPWSEIIIGSNGLLQGMTKLEKVSDVKSNEGNYKAKKKKICSEIARYAMRETFNEILQLIGIHEIPTQESNYNEWKTQILECVYHELNIDNQSELIQEKKSFSEHPIFRSWIGNKHSTIQSKSDSL